MEEDAIVVDDPTLTPDKPTDTSDQQQQQDLIAGKFKSQDDLIKAYQALEQKQSATSSSSNTPQDDDADEGDADVPLSPSLSLEDVPQDTSTKTANKTKKTQTASQLVDSFENDFAETGELTDKQVKALAKKGMSQEDALLLLNTRKDAAEKYITDLLEPVGGPEGWQAIQTTLKDNMSDEMQGQFNEAMNTGNDLMKSLLIQHAKETVDQLNGEAPKGQIKADSAQVSDKVDVFSSQADMAKAVGDPRYITDYTYRNEVEAKIARSDLDLMNGK